MAIYHFSAQVISRSKGQCAVASAAYRSGERLHDERTGENKYYVRKVEPENLILSPSHAPDWVQDRNRLWNEVEKAETRKNSQLAREINVALPIELSHGQQKELIKQYVQTEFVDRGMVADIAIHRDHPDNPHAHIMLTTREVAEEGFTTKNRSWNDRELLNQWREEWANHTNHALEREGVQERISHLSHEARGLEQLPTIHLGHVAHEMEKKGVETDRGNINRERQAYNAVVVDLQEYRAEKQRIQQRISQRTIQQEKGQPFYTDVERVALEKASEWIKKEATPANIEKRLEQLDKWEKRTNDNSTDLRQKEEDIRKVSDHYSFIHTYMRQIKENQEKIKTINWMNPLKLQENLRVKKEAEQAIKQLHNHIDDRQDNLQDYREKLGFKEEKEFREIKEQHQKDYPALTERNRNIRGRILEERRSLENAQTAHEKAFIRGVARSYPNHPEMHCMSLSTAQAIAKVNKDIQRVVPIRTIQRNVDIKSQEVERLQKTISGMDQSQQAGKQVLERSLSTEQSNLDLLKGIIQGLEQAARNMQKEEQKQNTQKKKRHRKGKELER
ncbi:MAG: MobQ family relaxase [Oliverpabstia sp.]